MAPRADVEQTCTDSADAAVVEADQDHVALAGGATTGTDIAIPEARTASIASRMAYGKLPDVCWSKPTMIIPGHTR
jgi:hypothetical protein